MIKEKTNKNCPSGNKVDNVKNHTLKCIACLVLDHPKNYFSYSLTKVRSLRKNNFFGIKLIRLNLDARGMISLNRSNGKSLQHCDDLMIINKE